MGSREDEVLNPFLKFVREREEVFKPSFEKKMTQPEGIDPRLAARPDATLTPGIRPENPAPQEVTPFWNLVQNVGQALRDASLETFSPIRLPDFGEPEKPLPGVQTAVYTPAVLLLPDVLDVIPGGDIAKKLLRKARNSPVGTVVPEAVTAFNRKLHDNRPLGRNSAFSTLGALVGASMANRGKLAPESADFLHRMLETDYSTAGSDFWKLLYDDFYTPERRAFIGKMDPDIFRDPKKLRAVREDISRISQESLKRRGAPEEMFVFRSGPVFKGEVMPLSVDPWFVKAWSKGNYGIYKVPREKVLVDVDAFSTHHTEGEVLARTEDLEPASISEIGGLAFKTDKGSDIYVIPTAGNPYGNRAVGKSALESFPRSRPAGQSRVFREKGLSSGPRAVVLKVNNDVVIDDFTMGGPDSFIKDQQDLIKFLNSERAVISPALMKKGIKGDLKPSQRAHLSDAEGSYRHGSYGSRRRVRENEWEDALMDLPVGWQTGPFKKNIGDIEAKDLPRLAGNNKLLRMVREFHPDEKVRNAANNVLLDAHKASASRVFEVGDWFPEKELIWNPAPNKPAIAITPMQELVDKIPKGISKPDVAGNGTPLGEHVEKLNNQLSALISVMNKSPNVPEGIVDHIGKRWIAMQYGGIPFATGYKDITDAAGTFLLWSELTLEEMIKNLGQKKGFLTWEALAHGLTDTQMANSMQSLGL